MKWCHSHFGGFHKLRIETEYENYIIGLSMLVVSEKSA
jgi:hypothetical protein